MALRRPRRRSTRLSDAEPAEVLAPAALARTARAVHRAGRHRPAGRCGVRAHVVDDEAAEDPGQPRRTRDEPAVRDRAARGDEAVLGAGTRGVLVRDGIPGLPAGDRVRAEHAARPRARRLQRARTPPEPADTAGAATRQAVGVLHPVAPAVHPTGQSLVLRGGAVVLRRLRRPAGADLERHVPHAVLVRLVLTAPLRHMRLYA